MPDPPEGLLGFDRAVELALQRIRDADVATRWSSASTPGAPSDPLPERPGLGGRQPLRRRPRIDRSRRRRAALWPVIEGIGGDNGWYSLAPGLAGPRLAGPAVAADPACGAAGGTRRACRSATPLDWWRVEEVEDGSSCGCAPRCGCRAWPGSSSASRRDEQGRTVFRQRALFHPRGLPGQLYWWAVKPFHGVVFGGMQRNVARAAEEFERSVSPTAPTPARSAP